MKDFNSLNDSTKWNLFSDFKVIIVGDGSIGKSCFLKRLTKDKYSKKYKPTIFEGHSPITLKETGNEMKVVFWDSSGQIDMKRIRKLTYSDTDLFVIAFDITSEVSFHNVRNIWIKEIQAYFSLNSSCPIILVGLKSDLKDSKCMTNENQIKKLIKDINAISYVECSAKTNENCSQFIKTLTKTLVKEKKKRKMKNKALFKLFKKKEKAKNEENDGNLSKTAMKTSLTLDALFQMNMKKKNFSKSIEKSAHIINEFISNEIFFLDNLRRLMENSKQIESKIKKKETGGTFSHFMQASNSLLQLHFDFVNQIIDVYDLKKAGFLIYKSKTQAKILEKFHIFFMKKERIVNNYFLYLKNYLKIKKIVGELGEKKKNQDIFLKLDIYSLLVTPIQKIARYKLFFENFRKLEHVKNHRKMNKLSNELFRTSDEICNEINHRKKEMEKLKGFIDLEAELKKKYQFKLFNHERITEKFLEENISFYKFHSTQKMELKTQEKMDFAFFKDKILVCYPSKKKIVEKTINSFSEFHNDTDLSILTLKIGSDSFHMEFDIEMKRNLGKYFGSKEKKLVFVEEKTQKEQLKNFKKCENCKKLKKKLTLLYFIIASLLVLCISMAIFGVL